MVFPKNWIVSGVCCLTFLVALVWSETSGSIPGRERFSPRSPCDPCTCLILPRRLRLADCSKLGLTTIPSNLPQNIDVLDLSNNLLRRHMLISIRKFVNVKYLNLAHNKIDIILGSDFEDLEFLQQINLTGNYIVGIARKPFQKLGERLRSIIGFEAQRFKYDVFENLDKMKRLSIVFHQSPIPSNIFSPLKGLQHLQVSIIKSTTIPNTLFTMEGGSLLKNLQIEANNLLVIPETILQGLTELSKFTIIGERLGQLPNNIFHGNGDTEGENVVNLDEIIIKGITQLPGGLFQKQLKVRKIVLNDISVIELGLFRDLTTLVDLDISQSAVGNISRKWLSGCVSLRSLNLSHTNLTTIGLGTFTDLSSLAVLDISNNKIRNITGDILRPTRHSLTILNVSMNLLEDLPDGILTGMHKLEVLDISYNSLTSLPAALLADAVILKRLYAKGNNIVVIPDSFFDTQYDLLQVDFSHNNISSLELGSLSNAVSIQKVVIDNNPLECGCPVVELFSYPGLEMSGTCLNIGSINSTTEQLNSTYQKSEDCYISTHTTLGITSPLPHTTATANVSDPEFGNVSTTSIAPMTDDSVLVSSDNRAPGVPDNPEMVADETESVSSVAMYTAVTAFGIIAIVSLSWVGIYMGRRYTRERAYYTSGSQQGRGRFIY